jgi:alanine racemase
MLGSHTRPVWAEISLARLSANYLALKELAPAADLLAVAKANAYGHGASLCAPALVAAGASWLGVTSVEEGALVRRACADASPRILVMSGIHPGDAPAVLELALTPVVWEHYHLDLLEAEAARRTLPPQSLPVHLELDTGMSRQGVPTPESPSHSGFRELTSLLARFSPESPLRLEGILTHFHSPELLPAGGSLQIVRLEAALDLVRARNLTPPILHAGNSATVLAGPDQASLNHLAALYGMRLMLRPGLALYGCPPAFTPPQQLPFQLLPVLRWKTRVNSLRTIPTGAVVGYNSTFRAYRPTRIALLPVGYADGYNRLLSSRGRVLLRGDRAPIAGRVSMDQTAVDVTDIPGVSIGDEVVLLGRDGIHAVTADDLATMTGTIAYETLCAISARVPRIPAP